MKRRDLMPGVAAADPRSVLRFAPRAGLASIDPIQSIAPVSRNHAALVCDTLFGVDESHRPLPQMLEGADTSDDKPAWVLTPRDGLVGRCAVSGRFTSTGSAPRERREGGQRGIGAASAAGS